MTLTYTSTATPVATPVLGAAAANTATGSAGPGGLTFGGAAGARRVQGYRFTYNQQRSGDTADFRALIV